MIFLLVLLSILLLVTAVALITVHMDRDRQREEYEGDIAFLERDVANVRRQMQVVVNTFEEANVHLDPNARGAGLANALRYSQGAQRMTWSNMVNTACRIAAGGVTDSRMRDLKHLDRVVAEEAERTGMSKAAVLFANLPKN